MAPETAPAWLSGLLPVVFFLGGLVVGVVIGRYWGRLLPERLDGTVKLGQGAVAQGRGWQKSNSASTREKTPREKKLDGEKAQGRPAGRETAGPVLTKPTGPEPRRGSPSPPRPSSASPTFDAPPEFRPLEEPEEDWRLDEIAVPAPSAGPVEALPLLEGQDVSSLDSADVADSLSAAVVANAWSRAVAAFSASRLQEELEVETGRSSSVTPLDGGCLFAVCLKGSEGGFALPHARENMSKFVDFYTLHGSLSRRPRRIVTPARVVRKGDQWTLDGPKGQLE